LLQHFETESKEAGVILCKLFEVLGATGAEFHPGVVVYEKSGHISLFCRRYPNEKIDLSIVKMPRSCIIPTNDLEWEERDDFLSLAKQPAALSGLQIELLNLHIELYNALGKISRLSRHHPDPLLKTAAKLLSAVQRVKPGTDPDFYNLSQRFIQTRNFCIHSCQPENQVSKKSGIVPILDCMNHNHQGLSLTWAEEDVYLKSDSACQRMECFLNYGGRRDVIDLALSMAYLDKATPYASSAPVQVIVPELGAVTVEGLSSYSTHALDPPRVEFNETEMQLSHVTVNSSTPKSFHVAMSLVAQGFLRKHCGEVSKYNHLNSSLKASIVNANISLLEEVYLEARQFSTEWPAAELLIKASQRQKEIWLTLLD
jgi:hypothetical protein